MAKKTILLSLLALSLFLRLILIPNPGFEADVSFWKSWGLATVDKGIVEGMKVTNNNYPTPFAYTLGAMVWVYKLFADPHAFNEFWKNTNLLFLTISKLFPILADFGIAAIILYIGKYSKKLGFPQLPFTVYQLLALVYLLNPIAIIDGAWWGQVDSLGVFLFLIAVACTLSRRPLVAGLVFMLAMMTKLQNMIYGPLFFLFVWQTTGYRGLIRAITGATIGFFGLNIEFVLSRNMDRVLASLTENYDYFPWMSLMAYNLWWIVTGARGMVTSDKLTMIGMVNAKTIGLLLFSSFYLFAMLRQVLWRLNEMNILGRMSALGGKNEARGGVSRFAEATGDKIFEDRFPSFKTRILDMLAIRRGYLITESSASSGARKFLSPGAKLPDLSAVLRTFLENLIIVNAAFFLFQTQSHDRYAFPLSVFLLLWAPFYISGHRVQGTGYRIKLFMTFYVLFTVFYFYNLHTALVVNYPNNGLPLLSLLTQPVFTISTAVILLLLFGVFLFTILRSSLSPVPSTLLPLGLFVASLLWLNKPLLLKQSISLTKFTPYISEQAYGTRQTNRSVQSSFGGPFKWTRLSVQYLFYRSGIGTHANSKQVFDINKKFKKLTTDFGIDTEAGTRASAIFEIYGDNKLLYRSDKMGRFDLPRHAEVDVAGVKFLSLVTTDAGDGNFDDHTDWLNPTLYP